jgi:hypothetical protein
MQTTTANATPASEKTSAETVASSTCGVKLVRQQRPRPATDQTQQQ